MLREGIHGHHVQPIEVSAVEGPDLERLQRASSTAARPSRRARAILLMTQGLSGVEIAGRIGHTVVQVSRIGPSSIAPSVAAA